MIEKDIERLLRERVKAMGQEIDARTLCVKFVSPGFSGVPDRLILLPGGVAVFAELKAPGKRERPLQRSVQSTLRGMGFKVFSSVDSPARVNEVVEYCRAVIRHD